MNRIKTPSHFLIILTLGFGLFFPSVGSACLWYKVSQRRVECRVPYRNYRNLHPDVKKTVLEVAMAQAKSKMAEILNKSDVLALLAESEDLYSAGSTEKIDKLVEQSDQMLQFINEIILKGERYEETDTANPWVQMETYDMALGAKLPSFEEFIPSAFMVGFTRPFKEGFQIPDVGIAKISKLIPNFKIGRGSAFIAWVIVPQFTRFVAIEKPDGFFPLLDDHNRVMAGDMYDDEDLVGAVEMWSGKPGVHGRDTLKIYDMSHDPHKQIMPQALTWNSGTTGSTQSRREMSRMSG
ncbi:MAG: hypothetical protein AAF203_08070, partial [Pseudomonadota bacterium]